MRNNNYLTLTESPPVGAIPEVLFADFDKNMDGFIEETEIEQYFYKLGYDDPIEVKQLAKYGIARQDKDDDGKLSFEEFNNPEINPQFQEECIKALFGYIDKNKDGFLDKAEVRRFMEERYAGIPDAPEITDEFVNEAVVLGDKDEDGKLSFKEFKDICME